MWRFISHRICSCNFNFVIVSIVSFVSRLDDETRIFKIIDFCFSLVGLVLSSVDVFVYLYVIGRKVCKKLIKCDFSEISDDETTDCCKGNCCCNKSGCHRRLIAVMDIVRIFILETIFYPNLLMSIFWFSVEFHLGKLVTSTWLAFVGRCFLNLVMVYVKRAGIFLVTVYSVKALKS